MRNLPKPAPPQATKWPPSEFLAQIIFSADSDKKGQEKDMGMRGVVMVLNGLRSTNTAPPLRCEHDANLGTKQKGTRKIKGGHMGGISWNFKVQEITRAKPKLCHRPEMRKNLAQQELSLKKSRTGVATVGGTCKLAEWEVLFLGRLDPQRGGLFGGWFTHSVC